MASLADSVTARNLTSSWRSAASACWPLGHVGEPEDGDRRAVVLDQRADVVHGERGAVDAGERGRAAGRPAGADRRAQRAGAVRCQGGAVVLVVHEPRRSAGWREVPSIRAAASLANTQRPVHVHGVGALVGDGEEAVGQRGPLGERRRRGLDARAAVLGSCAPERPGGPQSLSGQPRRLPRGGRVRGRRRAAGGARVPGPPAEVTVPPTRARHRDRRRARRAQDRRGPMASVPGVDHPEEQTEAEITFIGRGISVTARVEVVTESVVIRPPVRRGSSSTTVVASPATPSRSSGTPTSRSVRFSAEVTEVERPPSLRWRMPVTRRRAQPAPQGGPRAGFRFPCRRTTAGIELVGETIDLSETGLRAHFDGYGLPPEPGRSST